MCIYTCLCRRVSKCQACPLCFLAVHHFSCRCFPLACAVHTFLPAKVGGVLRYNHSSRSRSVHVACHTACPFCILCTSTQRTPSACHNKCPPLWSYVALTQCTCCLPQGVPLLHTVHVHAVHTFLPAARRVFFSCACLRSVPHCTFLNI